MGWASPSAGSEKIERGVSRGEILVETCWVTEQPWAHKCCPGEVSQPIP